MQLTSSMIMLTAFCVVSVSARVAYERAPSADRALPVDHSSEPPPAPAANNTAPLAARATCNRHDGLWCIDGFEARTPPHGSGISSLSNVGNPWGSNIRTIDASLADQYKYTIKFVGSSNMRQPYRVVAWNRVGPDGGLDGWYGHAAVSFSLAPGGVQYVAFDEDSEGGFGAAPGGSLPKNPQGAYDCTWGEFDFGSSASVGWSSFDVSMLAAQAAGAHVQGLSICDVTNGSGVCSSITTNAGRVINAYTQGNANVDGIGGNLPPGKVRLQAVIEYNG